MSDETDWEQFYKRLESENAELRRQNAQLSAACKAKDAALEPVLEASERNRKQVVFYQGIAPDWVGESERQILFLRTLLQRLVEQVDAIYTNATDTLDRHPISWHKENCQCPYHAAKRELESK